MFKFVSISVSLQLLSNCIIQLQYNFSCVPILSPLVQTLLTFLVVGVATMVANGQVYDDETADIVEMAFEQAEADYYANDNDAMEDNLGYVYNDSALEDNINVAVNAAILDKYGQAVTSERAAQESDLVEKSENTVENNQVDEVITKEDSDSAVKVEKTHEPIVEEKSSKVVKSHKTAKSLVAKTAKKVVTAKPIAKPVQNIQYDDNDTITRFVSQVNADGTYGFDFAQSSGLEFKEKGQGGLFAEGSYQYISPEGEHISVTYKADENGFHPESNILPTPPPIPAYILKALEYIREHPSAEQQQQQQQEEEKAEA
ncbi:uncharacterized protein LOC133327967 [Musca vetustissima]|uniref:uncharacterized protein LOC133327967 n=1 Tax=Musca vetustissima TaxID=27455 RepID=UPI002AB72EB6|nr:uncharacterized protein LOC133327967 [Musca vetustissima]